MRNVVTPVKVGVLVVLAIAAFVIFFSLIREKVSAGNANQYWALFHDASGLAPKSMVRVAGVEVGTVTSIGLVGGEARVDFAIAKDIPIYPNATVSKRSSSILGDYLLDVAPGAPQPIAGTDRYTEPLPPGSEIKNVQEAVGMEQLFDSLGEVAGDIKSVTKTVRELVEGERGTIRQIVQNLADVSVTLDESISRSSGQLDRALADVEVITGKVRELTTEHQGDVSEIITNVRVITEQARDVVASIRSIVGEHQGELEAGANGIQGSLDNLNRTLANLESITGRIDRGEGALGKLVADKELGERIDSAVTSTTDYVHRLSVLQVELALRSEYLFRATSAKLYLDLRLIPSPDKYFLFQVVDDPLGFVSRETVIRTPPGEVEAANQEVRTTSDQLLFSAEFAKRYGFATFRFGLIESTGGAGLDLHFLEDRLAFKLDLFDFANPETEFPRLKMYANLIFLQHLYVTAGVDDLMNRAAFEAVTGRLRAGRDAFVGGGIFFTDEDLKVLFGVTPTVIP